MELTAKYLSKNPTFIEAAKELEPIIEKSLLQFLKLPKEQKKSWSKKLEVIAKEVKSGKLQSEDLPKDFIQQFGLDPSDRKKLEGTMKTFVSGMNLKNDLNKMDRKEVEGEMKSALEIINFGNRTLSNISYDMINEPIDDVVPPFETNEDRRQQCRSACNVSFNRELLIAFAIFGALILTCVLFTLLSFGIAAGPCFSTALAIFLSLTAIAAARLDACLDNCN